MPIIDPSINQVNQQNYGYKVPATYQPHTYEVRKDDIYLALRALEIGLANTQELLLNHKSYESRASKCITEMYEKDIVFIQSAIKALKENPKEEFILPSAWEQDLPGGLPRKVNPPPEILPQTPAV